MHSVSPVLLVVDDDPDVRHLLERGLVEEGYRVELAADGTTALARLASGGIDLIILDRGLPGMDGIEICRRLRARAREQGAGLPVIMLTAALREAERLEGFAAGVDDYVTKPFSLGELAARIAAVFRRTRPALTVSGRVAVDERLQLDLDELEVMVAGERVALRPTEARLLALLVERAGQTVSSQDILARVWGPEYRDEVHYVHLYITYLRKKIEPDPSRPRYILTRRGQGYQFSPFAGQGVGRAVPSARIDQPTVAR
jgi:two-component system, OmpR family, KDP operon response regulator KdpE